CSVLRWRGRRPEDASMPRRTCLVLALALPAFVGCNSEGLPSDQPDLYVAPDLVPPPPPPDLMPPPTASGIGDGCTGNGFSQGSCNDGQICIPDGQFGFTDGYCTAPCDGANTCPSDARCVQVAPGMSFCFLRCQSDADCRAPDYECNGQAHVCLPVDNGGGVKPGTANGNPCSSPEVLAEQATGRVFGAST